MRFLLQHGPIRANPKLRADVLLVGGPCRRVRPIDHQPHFLAAAVPDETSRLFDAASRISIGCVWSATARKGLYEGTVQILVQVQPAQAHLRRKTVLHHPLGAKRDFYFHGGAALHAER